MEILNNSKSDYWEAQKQVKQIKGFYTHLIVYVCVNLFLIGLQAVDVDKGEEFWSLDLLKVPALWGIGLGVHWMSAFLPTFILGRNWEEKKIRELMNEEKRSISK